MNFGVIVILSLLCIAYLLLGVMTTDMVLDDTFRSIPKKYRPVARLFSVLFWPVILLIGMVVIGLTFIFKEWFE